MIFSIEMLAFSSDMLSSDELKKAILSYNPKADITMIQLAYDFAKEAHAGQYRLNGEEYFSHCVGTARQLIKMQLDDPTIIAGFLHDVVDETSVSIEDIRKNFGNDVAFLVHGVSKLGNLKYRGIEKYADNLRKLFVSLASDIRIIFIKFADRIHNLETLDALPNDKQVRIAREVIDIYAPIADRLGIGYVKGILEDLAFQYVYPEVHAELVAQTGPVLLQKEQEMERIRSRIPDELESHGIVARRIESRVKSLVSIYRKMQKKETTAFEGIYDLVALRIIVQTIGECYAALGMIHQRYKPMPGRIKDYIAQPKPNNYRALHTTVFCDDGAIVEFQIQTHEMNSEAKYGVAAHWHYSESRKRSEKITKKLDWLNEIIALQEKSAHNTEEYLRTLKLDVFKHRIFVFTPKGDVINLPEDANAIDFAYHIHSDIGRRCSGAKINRVMSPLEKPLKSGDVVEIITEKNRKKPSAHWLNVTKTHHARAKIRSQLREDGLL